MNTHDVLSLLSTRHKVVLDGLAEGFSDSALARRIGYSERTIRRLLAEAMEKLGADTRFQAGAIWALLTERSRQLQQPDQQKR